MRSISPSVQGFPKKLQEKGLTSGQYVGKSENSRCHYIYAKDSIVPKMLIKGPDIFKLPEKL